METIVNKLLENIKQKKNIKKISKEFHSLKNDFDRFQFALNILTQNEEILNSSIDINISSNKNISESIEYRNQGNKAFKNKFYYQALELYTQSVAFSPIDSNIEEISLAFANRSVVLFSLSKYQHSLIDINLALKYNYPKKLTYKLFERKARILQILHQNVEALSNFQNALQMLEHSHLSIEKRIQIEKEINDLINQTNINNTKNINKELDIMSNSSLPEKCYGQNNQILSSSDCVEICYNNNIGRHLISNRDINPGDVLIVEQPFSSILLKEYCYTHCFNCLKRNFTLIPCFFCSLVMFCSNECLETAWNNYHKIECKLLPLLRSLKISHLQHLSLRIVLNATKCGENLNEIYQYLTNEITCENQASLGMDSNFQYNSLNYFTIFHLIANSNKRTLDDLFKRALFSSILIKCLQIKSSFFNYNQDHNINIINITGGLILRHLQNLPCNAHEISELIIKNNKSTNNSKGIEMIEIGAAAYSTLSLLNHSCNPNVSRHCYQGNICVLRAVKDIKRGEQLLDNYGHHFALESLEDRQQNLKFQYFFSCECEACLLNWPLYDQIPDKEPNYKCSKCLNKMIIQNINTAICSECKTEFDIENIRKIMENSSKKYKEIFDNVLGGKEIEQCNLQHLIDHLHLIDKYYILPWKEFNDCQELLKHCFNMKGNYMKFS